MPSLFSIAFSAACAFYLFIGIYTFYLNPHARTNILFFVLTVTLDIWAFSFSMAILADERETALFWRRFAALGWGTFFSILLRFSHEFTNSGALGRKKWYYALIYLPTIAVYLGFTYFPNLNPGQYNLVQTPMGWVNIAANNAWDIFYMVFYLSYSAASLVLIWRWGRKSTVPREKKQSRLILISFVSTMLISSFTDTLGNVVFFANIPQLAPILMVFPALAIYYSIKKHGFMNPLHVDQESILMTDQIRIKATNYMSNAFLFAGLLHVVSSFLLTKGADLIGVLSFSVFLVLIGVILQAIQRSVKSKGKKDFLNAAVFSLIVPILSFRFIENANITIWAFPFILLIITLLYGKSFIQITLFISILLTQIAVWVIKPEVMLKVDGADHAVRLGLFLIAIWFAYFARKMFQSKLKENAEQIRAQQIIMEISSDFIIVNERDCMDKVDAALCKFGAFLNINRAYVFLFDDKQVNMTCRSIWSNPEKNAGDKFETTLYADVYPLLMAHIKAGNPIELPDLSDAPGEIGNDPLRFLGGYEKSFVTMPIVIKNEVCGFLGLDAERKRKNWPETHIAFVRILSNIIADALERIHQENEISQMAFFDDLTKLPNRLLFKDRITQAINLAERTNNTLAVVFLDLDAFKNVNDTIGHGGGDALIVNTAEQLKTHLRKSDTVSRFGGDEFLLLLNNLNSTGDIQGIIDKIMGVFSKPFNINGHEFFITASAGIAVYPYDGTDAEELVKNADIAMYKSKELGKNRYMLCTDDMKEEVLQKMKLTRSLYRALERNEFHLYYQPQVNTQSKRVVGAEALLRWVHPEYGMVSPGLFIPLAEHAGLISPIGNWVLLTACRQCKTWQMNGLPGIGISVNVSILQLRNPEFVSHVGHILEETQLDPQYLELEITESATVSESEDIIAELENLKKLGVSISIDDFGTEYSSLSRLSSMPIDRIKLDMTFVHGIGRNRRGKEIIKGIIDLAHNLGLKVTAEGVETEQQYHFLSECRSDSIQGFYFFRPLPPTDLEKSLKN